MALRAALLLGVKSAKLRVGSLEILVHLSTTFIVVYCQVFVQNSGAVSGFAVSRGLKLAALSR